MPAAQHSWLVSVQDATTTLSPDRRTVIAFDLEGRPTSWFTGGDTFKRSLASEIFGRRTVDGDRRRWRVDQAAADVLFGHARAVAGAARAAWLRGAPLVERAQGATLETRFATILAWTPATLAAERKRFLGAYAPISILPPDQYGAVVLQATFGCSWNRCTYCSFYQGRPFQVRPSEAFDAHVDAVAALLGQAAAGRRSIFLADGNALVLSNERLRPIVEHAGAVFPGRPLAGFVDVFSGERKSEAGWRELQSWGLERVAIGVETGHDALLAYLDKPGSADEAASFVALLKRAGLRVSVILMVGVGGRRYAERHLRDTSALLRRLPLGDGDIVYLSPFVRHHDSRYAERASADGLVDLNEAERAEQYAALRRAAHGSRARVARYHIDEFIY
jgi:hypothetical protein